MFVLSLFLFYFLSLHPSLFRHRCSTGQTLHLRRKLQGSRARCWKTRLACAMMRSPTVNTISFRAIGFSLLSLRWLSYCQCSQWCTSCEKGSVLHRADRRTRCIVQYRVNIALCRRCIESAVYHWEHCSYNSFFFSNKSSCIRSFQSSSLVFRWDLGHFG